MTESSKNSPTGRFGVVPVSVRGPAALEELRHTVILDMPVCAVFAGLIPLPRLSADGTRASASVVVLIALALCFLTPAVYTE
jgi:hypothetical protein